VLKSANIEEEGEKQGFFDPEEEDELDIGREVGTHENFLFFTLSANENEKKAVAKVQRLDLVVRESNPFCLRV